MEPFFLHHIFWKLDFTSEMLSQWFCKKGCFISLTQSQGMPEMPFKVITVLVGVCQRALSYSVLLVNEARASGAAAPDWHIPGKCILYGFMQMKLWKIAASNCMWIYNQLPNEPHLLDGELYFYLPPFQISCVIVVDIDRLRALLSDGRRWVFILFWWKAQCRIPQLFRPLLPRTQFEMQVTLTPRLPVGTWLLVIIIHYHPITFNC